MKRFLTIILIAVLVLSLGACSMGTDGTKINGTESTEATEAPKVDITKYAKDFDGLQAYLIDMELLSDKDSDKTETNASIIGATKGVRYTIGASAFIEFYELNTKSTPDEAQTVYDSIQKDGTFDVLGFETLNGVYSSSGRFLAVYKGEDSKSYDEIIEEFKKF